MVCGIRILFSRQHYLPGVKYNPRLVPQPGIDLGKYQMVRTRQIVLFVHAGREAFDPLTNEPIKLSAGQKTLQ